MQLPFLVVHGALVWKVILVAFVAICLAIFFAIRYALVRAGNRAAARDLDTIEEGVVRGTLRGGIASTLYAVSTFGRAVQPNLHIGDLFIETPDGPVALEGDLRVAAGARIAARRRRVPAGTPEQLSQPLADLRESKIATAVLHQVGDGDEVIAKGPLVREAGDEATDYRENATRRVLRGSIAIAARHPTTHVVRPNLFVIGALLAACTFIGYNIEAACGKAWRDTCRDGHDLELANGNACVMASVMPNQDGALSWLLEMMDRKPIPSEAALQARIALSHVVDDCRASLFRLQQIDRPELVLEEARHCGDFDEQEVALANLGRFAEAAAVPSQLGGYRTDVRGRILVLAGAWRQVAAFADERATALLGRPADPDPDRRELFAAETVEWQCVSALMLYYAGTTDTSLARIRSLAAGPHGDQCAPELAEAGTDEERARVLAGTFDLGRPWRVLELERQLAGLGMANDEGVPSLLLQGSDALGMAHGPAVWATRIAPPVPESAPVEQRFADATHRLAIAVWMRDFATAHRYADRAIELASDERAGYDAQFTPLFHPMIDLYTAKTPLDVPPPRVRNDPQYDDALAGIWSLMTPRLRIRHGDPFDSTTFVVTTEMQSALLAAQHGDGAALADTLGNDNTMRPLDLIAVLPMIKTHRDDVVRALPWMSVSSQVVDYRFPFSTAQYYAERRAMFELAGDPTSAKRAGDVFDRYAAAFHDHRRLVALALLDLD